MRVSDVCVTHTHTHTRTHGACLTRTHGACLTRTHGACLSHTHGACLCLGLNIPCISIHQREGEFISKRAVALDLDQPLITSTAMPIPVAGERGDGTMDGGDEQGCHDA